MKKSLAILLSGLLLSLGSESKAETPNEWLILKEMRSTVHILGQYESKSGGFISSCSGAWIGQRHMITANHCLITEQEGIVNGHKETGVLTKIVYDTVFSGPEKDFAGGIVRVASNQSCDVMIVRTDDPAPDHEVVELRKTDLKIGERVATIGHPGTVFFVHTFGEVSRINIGVEKISSQPFFYLVDITLGHGNSGGPLYDMNGKLAGVSSAILTTGEAEFGVFSNRMCITTMVNESKKVEKEHVIEW